MYLSNSNIEVIDQGLGEICSGFDGLLPLDLLLLAADGLLLAVLLHQVGQHPESRQLPRVANVKAGVFVIVVNLTYRVRASAGCSNLYGVAMQCILGDDGSIPR